MRDQGARVLWMVAGLGVLLILAVLRIDPRLPAPLALAERMWRDGPTLAIAAATTGEGALVGLAAGLGIGAVLASCAVIASSLRGAVGRVLDQTLTVTPFLEILPVVVLAPAITAVVSTDRARVLLAFTAVVLSCTTMTWTSLAAWARSAPAVQLHHPPTGIAGRVRVGIMVDGRPLLSAVLGSAPVTIPAAFLGSLIAEFYGADSGLGTLVLSGLAHDNYVLVWAACFVLWLCSGTLILGARILREALSVGVTTGTQRTGNARPFGFAIDTGTVLIALGAVWVLARATLSETGAVPTVDAVVSAVLNGRLKSAGIWAAIATTATHWVLATCCGILVSFVVSMAAWRSPTVRAGVGVLLVALRGIPFVVLVPISAAVVGRGDSLIAFVGVLVFGLPVVEGVLAGLRAMPRRLLEIQGPTPGWRLTRYVVLGAALRRLAGLLTTGAPTTFAGVLLVEWLACGDGLGTLIVASTARMDVVVAWVGALVALGLAGAVMVVSRVASNLVADGW